MLLVKTAELCIVTVGAVQMSGSGVATRSPTLHFFFFLTQITSEVFVLRGFRCTTYLLLNALRLYSKQRVYLKRKSYEIDHQQLEKN